jgi:hypothetical protein
MVPSASAGYLRPTLITPVAAATGSRSPTPVLTRLRSHASHLPRLLSSKSPSAAIEQTIPGFVLGGQYTLSFYLGSRYGRGDQTVEALLDGQVIGTWNLVSYTRFTLQTVPFSVATGGSHVLTFAGTACGGDHTAFFSGVSIQTTSSLTVSPSSAFPGVTFGVSAGGFAPNETVYLV